MFGESSGRQRPLGWSVQARPYREGYLTNVQFVSFHFVSMCDSCSHVSPWHSPFIVDGLDDEAQRGTDAVDILIHDLLHNRSLSSIVQSPALFISYLLSLRASQKLLTTLESASPCL